MLLESRDYRWPLFEEIRRMIAHVREVRQWVKEGIIRFAGDQVVYMKVYI